MTRCKIVAIGLCIALTGRLPAQPQHVAKTDPLTPAEQLKKFHLPPGFEIQLVAAEPDIRKPLNLHFDERNRLWVTGSVEYPFPAADDAKKRDTLRILEDTDGDGRFEKVTVFADGLNIPIGVLPVRGGAIVHSIPNIWLFRDTDSDDKVNEREVLLSSFGFKDTHGMTGEFMWGFDGWVYACHGFANSSTLKAKDGSTISMQSGNTYRFRKDGSHVEQWTWGQVNPFGLAFDPLGNLFSCDCHSRPIYQLLRGAYYPSFGKPHDGLGFGPEMLTHSHGSTAIAGITYYAADHFPPAYRDTIFIGNVVTNRVNHDKLERHGSTYKAIEQPDFIRCDDPWFRPVDIKLGPDGALYIADFYNRIIGHYEVPLTHPGRDRERGRIWRVVYKGPKGDLPAPKMPRADWAKATVPELVDDLAHPNLAVRFKATNQLVERGGKPGIEAVRKALKPGGSPFQRMHGLWVLDRQNALDDELLTAAAQDQEPGVRVHAMRILSERRQLSPAQHKLALAGLEDKDAFVQRAAAEALGQHPSVDNIRPLLSLRERVPADDTHLMHMVRMSLRDQLRGDNSWAALPLRDWTDKDSRTVADIAPGVPGAASAAFLMQHLQKFDEPEGNQARFLNHVARYGKEADVKAALERVRDPKAATFAQLERLKAYERGLQARGKPLDDEARRFADGLAAKLIESKSQRDVLAGLDLCTALKLTSARGPILARVEDRKTPEPQRLAALKALASVDPDAAIPVLGKLLGAGKEPYALRELAAQQLGAINRAAAHTELVKGLAAAPARLQIAIAVGLVSSPKGGEQLLKAIEEGKASARLLRERQVEVRLVNSKLPDVQKRIDKLTKGLPPANEAVLALIQKRKAEFATMKPDAAQGAKIFEKTCAVCHTLANKGAKIGPELDGVGLRGIDRLLEDILDPSRNVDQAFRQTTLTLLNGQIVSGLLLRSEGEVLVLADNQGKEVRVAKKDVDEQIVGPLSPMPGNFSEQIPDGDFKHLLAFLLDQTKPKEQKPK
ncbi:MAG: PVC-type heme-binding CxxCH protein [Gemmataceae bacterium]